ncbi:hypothetical protein C8F04DRAFT_1235051 [Mycena alexandri]|uniref:Uncharacterized protein n=1 Tax=Mycena alexandri TaxID=1745969 RepID=A0AAD6SS45_9AGAR|nr:hypothetical protein C8F04DRAFT_1235051 [Mycena alexandri]
MPGLGLGLDIPRTHIEFSYDTLRRHRVIWVLQLCEGGLWAAMGGTRVVLEGRKENTAERDTPDFHAVVDTPDGMPRSVRGGNRHSRGQQALTECISATSEDLELKVQPRFNTGSQRRLSTGQAAPNKERVRKKKSAASRYATPASQDGVTQTRQRGGDTDSEEGRATAGISAIGDAPAHARRWPHRTPTPAHRTRPEDRARRTQQTNGGAPRSSTSTNPTASQPAQEQPQLSTPHRTRTKRTKRKRTRAPRCHTTRAPPSTARAVRRVQPREGYRYRGYARKGDAGSLRRSMVIIPFTWCLVLNQRGKARAETYNCVRIR